MKPTFRSLAVLAIVAFLALVTPIRIAAATLGVTVNSTNQGSTPFLPAFSTPTGVTNSAAWSASRTVLGVPSFTEGYEALTDAANVTLDWLKGRTKGVTLNQNTTFAFSNIPAGVTNIQTMVVQVTGDGSSSVSFTGAVWQTVEVPIPDAGVITLYIFRADAGTVKGYAADFTGGGGASLWNTVDGILVPEPDVNGVSIVSIANTTGTNILLNLDTTAPVVDDVPVPWVAGESLISAANAGSLQFRVDAVSGWTGTGTNYFGDDGKFHAQAGGGSTFWASSAGVLIPSPAVDVVNITSQLANANTNQALIVNTASGWTNQASLISAKNGGTNQFVVAGDGSLSVGRSTGHFVATPIAALYDRASGDPVGGTIKFDSIVDKATYLNYGRIGGTYTTNSANWGVRSFTNSLETSAKLASDVNTASMQIFYLGTNLMQLDPTQVASTTPFVFDTKVVHTSGLLAAIRNRTTNQFTLAFNTGYDGSGTHFLSDDGTYKNATFTNISSSVWRNVAGLVELIPSNTNNTVLITSQPADNPTNAALVVDTAVDWLTGESKLQRWSMHGTNQSAVFSDGALFLGPATFSDWGSHSFGGESIISYRDTAFGDQNYNEISFYSKVGSDFVNFDTYMSPAGLSSVSLFRSNSGGLWQANVSNDEVSEYLQLGADILTALKPTVASTGSSVAYLFNTSSVQTNGDLIASFQTAGVPVLTVSPETVSIISQNSDNPDNILLSLNTATQWTDTEASFIQIQNLNTNIYEFHQGFLEMYTTQPSPFVEITGFDGPDDTADWWDIYMDPVEGGSLNFFTAATGFSSGLAQGTNAFLLYSDEPTTILTSSNVVFRTSNTLLDKFTVNNAGNGFFAGTLSIGSLTNTFLASGGLVIYTNSNITTPGAGIRVQNGSIHTTFGLNSSIQPAWTASDGSGVTLVSGLLTPNSGVTMDLSTPSTATRWRDIALSRNVNLGGNVIVDGTTNSVGIFHGLGSPEGVQTAGPGSMWIDFGGTNQVKRTGTGNTGWKVIVTL